MKATRSIFQSDWQGKTMQQIDELMAQMPIAGEIDQINWQEYPKAPNTTFVVAHTETMMYVRFDVRGEMPVNVHTQDQEHVNEDACVEFFIGNAENTRYWNFEFNSDGVCYASSRISRSEGIVRFDADVMQEIKRYPAQLSADHWTLLVAIPIQLIELDPSRERARRANLYKCGDNTPMPHYASWNAIQAEKPNFHLPEFFGELQFS